MAVVGGCLGGACGRGVMSSGEAGADGTSVPDGTPAAFALLASPSVPVGTPFPVTVMAVDASGGPATQYTGTVSLASTDSRATLDAALTFTAVDAGRRTVMVTLVSPGPQRLEAVDEAGLRGASVGWNVDGVRFLAADAYGQHMCGVLLSGGVRCWGANDSGQLGLGDRLTRLGRDAAGVELPAVDLGAGRTVASLSLGRYHSCAVLDDGAVKCWGDNSYGELGVGDFYTRGDAPGAMGVALPTASFGTGRAVRSVSVGPEGTCVLLDTGAVKCLGNNDAGELGVGDTVLRGGAGASLGDALPAVALGVGRTAVQISHGGFHVCAVLDTRQVKCWGENKDGQLGLGDTEPRGQVPATLGDGLPGVALGTGRTAVALQGGSNHTCAVLDDGAVKCWGDNASGQLGLGDTLKRGAAPGQMGDALPAVALGAGRTAAALAVGLTHTCVSLDDGAVKCWGNNARGALGVGDTAPRGVAPQQMGDALPTVALGSAGVVRSLALGASFGCVLRDAGQVKCWGANEGGQLGLGDTLSRGDGPASLGDALPASAVW